MSVNPAEDWDVDFAFPNFNLANGADVEIATLPGKRSLVRV